DRDVLVSLEVACRLLNTNIHDGASRQNDFVRAELNVLCDTDCLTFVQDTEAVGLFDSDVTEIIHWVVPRVDMRILVHDQGAKVLAIEEESINDTVDRVETHEWANYDTERQAEVVRKRWTRLLSLRQASRSTCLTTSLSTLGVLSCLTLTEAEVTIVEERVCELVRLTSELGEERTTASLDSELAQHRVLYPLQPRHRVNEHHIRDETLHEDLGVHVVHVISGHRTVEL